MIFLYQHFLFNSSFILILIIFLIRKLIPSLVLLFPFQHTFCDPVPSIIVILSYTFSGGGGLVAKLCLTLATPWTVACQAPLSKRFSRQEYWSGLPFPSPGDLPDPGVEPQSHACKQIPASQVDSSQTGPGEKPYAFRTLPSLISLLSFPYARLLAFLFLNFYYGS